MSYSGNKKKILHYVVGLSLGGVLILGVYLFTLYVFFMYAIVGGGGLYAKFPALWIIYLICGFLFLAGKKVLVNYSFVFLGIASVFFAGTVCVLLNPLLGSAGL